MEEDREQALARRVLGAHTIEARAEHWANRYRPCIAADELAELGNAALQRIVRKFDEKLGAFDDYARRRLDHAMLSGIRVEARRKRIDWAAQLATADLLATHRGDPHASPAERHREINLVLAAAAFAAMTEEARRGGVDDMIAREDYATAMEVMASTLAAQPKPRRRLFVLNFQDGKSLEEIAPLLGVHRNTLENWRKKVLADIHAELVKRDILTAPGRGGALRVTVLAALRAREDKGRAANDDTQEDDDEDTLDR